MGASVWKWTFSCALFLPGASAGFADTDSAQALHALKICKEQSDAPACQRAIKLGLSAKLASEAYTFWADALPANLRSEEDSAKLLPKALQLDPNNALAAYFAAGGPPASNYKMLLEKKRLLEKVTELRPDWEGGHVNLAQVYAAAGQREEEIREWGKAVEAAPDDSVYRANYEKAKAQLEEAKAKEREAIEKAKADPDHLSAYVVWAAKWTCDVPKAEEYAAKVKTSWPSAGPGLLAQTYAACGEYEKARQTFGKIVEGFEKRVDAGLTYDEAIQVSDQSLQFLQLVPETARLNLVKASLEEKSEHWSIARSYLEAAERIAPTAEIYGRLARAILKGYGALGNAGEIADDIAKGLKLDAHLLEKYPELKPYAPQEKKE